MTNDVLTEVYNELFSKAEIQCREHIKGLRKDIADLIISSWACGYVNGYKESQINQEVTKK